MDSSLLPILKGLLYFFFHMTSFWSLGCKFQCLTVTNKKEEFEVITSVVHMGNLIACDQIQLKSTEHP